MKRGPFAPGGLCPADQHYYDPLRLPLDRPTHFPGSPVIGGHRFHRPAGGGAEEALPSSQDDLPHVQRPRLAGGFLSARFWIPGAFHGLRRRLNGSAPPLPRSQTGRLTTLAQASLTLQTARSHPPRFTPASRPRTGASLPGTQTSPRTGLTPAGRPELVARIYVMTEYSFSSWRPSRCRAHQSASDRGLGSCPLPDQPPGWEISADSTSTDRSCSRPR